MESFNGSFDPEANGFRVTGMMYFFTGVGAGREELTFPCVGKKKPMKSMNSMTPLTQSEINQMRANLKESTQARKKH